jgi:hypothetical protein
MASYKDVLKLIREGKSPAEVLAAIPGPPSVVKRVLCGRRFAAQLEMERQMSGRLGRHQLAVALHHLIQRRLELVDDENVETARKAAESLTETYSGKSKTPKEALREMQLQQKVDFLKQLVSGGGIDVQMLLKNHATGKYHFEEAIERWQNREKPRSQP